MLYAAAAILIVLGFVFPKNKVLTVVMLLFMWALLAYNRDNADYQNYMNIYNNIRDGNLWGTTVDEEGFIYLCRFCSTVLGLDYYQFLVLYSTICTVLFAVMVKLYTENSNIVIALFMIYSYWCMICQVRSYLATILAMIGLYFLFYHDGKMSWILFFAFVIAGGFFHRTAWFFLPFFVVKITNMKTIVIVTAAASVGFLSLRVPFVTKLVGLVLSQQKINNWLLDDGNRSIIGIGMLFFVRGLLIVIELMMFYSLSRNKKLSLSYFDRFLGRKTTGKVEFDAVAERIFKATVLSFAFVALEAFVRDYERLFRIVMLLSYVLFADFTVHKKVTPNKIPVGYVGYYMFFTLFMAYFLYGFVGWIDGALRPAFECNTLLK
ncbi:EpsG family protein [Ruminococcus flavefaciens]|uniref:EpsG family protein n=1 Tax=Ruminococcus flavefaciens TaxID=1265 RepID=UPI0026EB438D|nr:EpsG family protein [Ruminococcus flavefaciens]